MSVNCAIRYPQWAAEFSDFYKFSGNKLAAYHIIVSVVSWVKF